MSSKNTSVQLTDGILQNGLVETNKWLYYKYWVTPGDADIVVNVNSIYGDPDLYVNTKDV
jgi:hypothetical protein